MATVFPPGLAPGLAPSLAPGLAPSLIPALPPTGLAPGLATNLVAAFGLGDEDLDDAADEDGDPSASKVHLILNPLDIFSVKCSLLFGKCELSYKL